MSTEFNTQQQGFFSHLAHSGKKSSHSTTGQGHEGILGTAAGVEWIAELISALKTLRAKLVEGAGCEVCDVS